MPGWKVELEIKGIAQIEPDALIVTWDAEIVGDVVLKCVDGFATTAAHEFGSLLDVAGANDLSSDNFILQNLAFGFEVTRDDSGFMFTALTDGVFQQSNPGDYDDSGQVEQADLDLVP